MSLDAFLPLFRVRNSSRFGVAVVRDGRIVRFVEELKKLKECVDVAIEVVDKVLNVRYSKIVLE